MEGSAVADILAALNRTADAGRGRIVVSFAFRSLAPPQPRRRRGGLLRPLIPVGKAVAKQFGTDPAGRPCAKAPRRAALEPTCPER
jgi:hypothetical protein